MAIVVSHGDPLMVDYTSGTNVAAGSIVDIGAFHCIAHSDLVANVLGAVSWPTGTVVYDLSDETVGTGFTPGDPVYQLDSGSFSATDDDLNLKFFTCVTVDTTGKAVLVVND